MQHPDEGTIHAWLDEQLPRDEAAAIEAHVADCRPCADVVAEARGLIAASSRILMALDAVPRGVAPKQPDDAPNAVPHEPTPNAVVDLRARAAAVAAAKPGLRRWLRGPSLAAAAAVIVAVGSFAVLRNRTDTISVASEVAPSAASGPSVTAAPPMPAAGAANEARVAASESKSVAADRAERDQAQPPVAPPTPTRRLSAKQEGAVTGAKVGMRDEARQTESSRTADGARLAKERQGVAVDSVAVRKQLVASPTVAEPGQVKKPDTATITVLRGRNSIATSAAPPPAAVPAPQVQQPRQAPTEARDSRSDVAGFSRSGASTGFIRGRVTDGNGTGIAGAMVLISGSSTGVPTNDQGEFSLGGVAPGRVQLVVRRVGYEPEQRAVSAVAGQTVATDVILRPVVTSLSSVVVTGAPATVQRKALGASVAGRPLSDSAPGAAVSANDSNAIGCYELGVTPSSTQARTSLRQVPHRIALDGQIVPANADGIWYRARDLARTGAVTDGLWRPVGTDGVEIEWTYGSKIARIRLAGSPRGMMRGAVDEIDRSGGSNRSGDVVSNRRPCQ
jgi:hypothetical protein